MIEPENVPVYLARAGRYGEDEETSLENGLAIIGYREVSSLESAKSREDVASAVETGLAHAKKAAAANYTGQLWTFLHTMQQGDLVVMPRKQTSQIALGRVSGPYQYQEINGEPRHTRAVEWLRPDVPRTAFKQDLLYSFGAFMTVCRIKRNNAAERVQAVLEGGPDPGFQPPAPDQDDRDDASADVEIQASYDLDQAAHDQIVAHIQTHFCGHALSGLVEAVLNADGWVTKLSPPGPDGGVDILGGRGPLGLDGPRLCVQVKSQNNPADVTVYRHLQGTMQTYRADQGLIVCWGGFNKVVSSEARHGHFTVRLWDSRDLVKAIYRTYEQLPAEIQAELPLKRAWILVREGGEE